MGLEVSVTRERQAVAGRVPIKEIEHLPNAENSITSQGFYVFIYSCALTRIYF